MPAPLIVPLILAAGTSAVTTYFQNNAARIAEERNHKEFTLKTAVGLFETISVGMDTVAFLSSEAMYGLVYRPPGKSQGKYEERDKQMWDDYQKEITAWKRVKTKTTGEVEAYFGTEAKDVLVEIQKGIRTLDRFLITTYLDLKDNEDYLEEGSVGREKYRAVKEPHDEKMAELVQIMVKAINTKKIGSFG